MNTTFQYKQTYRSLSLVFSVLFLFFFSPSLMYFCAEKASAWRVSIDNSVKKKQIIHGHIYIHTIVNIKHNKKNVSIY